MNEQRRETQADKNLTYKIWAVLLVSILTTIGAFYWSYSYFKSLSLSVDQLSHPNIKVDIINEIFQEIIEGENHIQSYILTNDIISETIYNNKIKDVRAGINQLRDLLRDDSLQVERLDTLNTILSLKINYLERFLHFKKIRESSLFTNEALNRIALRMNDTAYIDKLFLKRETLKGNTFPVEREEIIKIQDDYKGLKGLFRKLFGRDNSRIDTIKTIETDTIYTYNVAVDTSIVRDYFRDSTLAEVKSILSILMQDEIKMIQQLNQTELTLLKQNQAFITSIRSIIEQLKKQEEGIATLNVFQAKSLAYESTKMLLIIGLAGLSMSGVFIFLILRDVTRTSHYRKLLEQQKAKAEKLANIKEEFLSNMSHDIRTPLHNILGFTSLLEQAGLTHKQEEYIHAINQSNSYLLELVNNILDVSRINAGKLYLSREPFDLAELLNELKSVFLFSALSKNIEIEIKVSDELKHSLVGDAFRIKQVLNNLLSNAIKFTDAGRISIVVDATKNAESYELNIHVSDTGVGIAGDKLAVIFDQFTQEKPYMNSTYGGTGLGLYIAKTLTEAMDGTITAKNNAGKGATFHISITLPYAEAAGAVSEATATPIPYFSHVHALVVEDDQWNARLMQEILAPRMEKVYLFHEAQEALKFLQNQEDRIDIIFTDINMPVLKGDAFMEQVKKLEINAPVIALTAHAQSVKINNLIEKGFEQVIKKPFTVKDVENILRFYFEDAAEGSAHHWPGQGQPQSNGEEVPFDLSEIKNFAGDDETVFARLLEELVENNRKQVQSFSKYIYAGESKKLGDLSHQMKTVYDQLKLKSISESLASIELYAWLGNHARVLETSRQVLPELEEVSRALNKIRHQFHIA